MDRPYIWDDEDEELLAEASSDRSTRRAMKRIAALEAANAKLREALGLIASWEEGAGNSAREARAALQDADATPSDGRTHYEGCEKIHTDCARTPRWLDELEALEKAATPGPWKQDRRDDHYCASTYVIARAEGDERHVACLSCNGECGGMSDEDEDLILALRNRLPQILRALRAATEMREKNISDCDAGEDCGPCNNCGVCRWDAAMADAPTATTEKGKA